MRRKLVHLAAVAALVVGVLGIVPSVNAACSTGLRFTLYENPNYGSAGTTPFVACSDTPNLNSGSCCWANPDSDCLAPLVTHLTWNDCASSWKFAGNCHYGVSMYADANYTGTLVWSTWGTKSEDGGFGIEDMISSVRWKYRATCPSSPT